MRKYKLIKEYPGSPNIGYIANETAPCIFNVEDKPVFNLHTYPNFWEEVIEKDYVILSLIGDKKNPTHKNTIIKCIGGNKKEPVKDFWNIHSIKRISDGEIFTIGDEVRGVIIKSRKIEKIILNDNKLRFIGENFIYGLNVLKHIKKPIFTTEDNVDIFPGDKYWIVYDGYKLSDGPWTVGVPFSRSSTDKYFYHKKSAYEYCFNHKPVLSLNDVRTHFKGDDDQWSELVEKLEEIVNKKF